VKNLGVRLPHVDDDTVCDMRAIQRIAHSAGELQASNFLGIAWTRPTIDLHEIVVAIGRVADLIVRLSGHGEPGNVGGLRTLRGAT